MFRILRKHNSIGRFSLLAGILLGLSLSMGVHAQTPTPTPTPDNNSAGATWGGYNVTASAEIGYRWRSLSGSERKFRSDLNYKTGFRSFDTNFLLETESGKGKAFDSLLVSNSGWGADPNGFVRVNMEKTGAYSFRSNVRRIQYFNNLENHALGEHTQNTRNTMGDFDLDILPQNERISFNVGASFMRYKGPGTWTVRGLYQMSDEFPVTADFENRSNDVRIGAEGKLFGFDWSVLQGFRGFNERSHYFVTVPNAGNNPANTVVLTTYDRLFPVNGDLSSTQGSLHRMFGDDLDVTARLIYVSTETNSALYETATGRDGANGFIDLDKFTVSGKATRIQTRGDIGATWNITNDSRLSNTFNFDKFRINGDENFNEQIIRRNLAGTNISPLPNISAAYRIYDYRRLANTIEFDHQFNNRVGFHVGYRYTHREVMTSGFNAATSPTGSFALVSDESTNATHTLLAGMKIKPVKGWAIFWDVEHGQADNYFVRPDNYKYTNFRARTNVNIKDVTFNVSGYIRNNENPSNNRITSATIDFVTLLRSRYFSASAEWNPASKFTLGGGYTFRFMNSHTPVFVPISSVLTQGTSDYYVRDHYFYVDASVKPFSRLSLYGSYRFNTDKGQGNRVSPALQFIIGSYPMNFTTPEFRAAIRINRFIDWNVGYQYYDYKDIQTPTQNYRAHLPYTSLRIYFGKDAGAR